MLQPLPAAQTHDDEDDEPTDGDQLSKQGAPVTRRRSPVSSATMDKVTHYQAKPPQNETDNDGFVVFIDLTGVTACGYCASPNTTDWSGVTCRPCFDTMIEGVAFRLRWLRLWNVTLRNLWGYAKAHPGPLVTLLGIVVAVLIWRFPHP